MESTELDPVAASSLRLNSTDVNCHPVPTEDGQMIISLPGFADDTIVGPSDNCDPNTEIEWSVQMDKSFEFAAHNQNLTNEIDVGIIAVDNLKLEEGFVKPDKLEEGFVKPDKQEEGYVKPDKQEEGYFKPDKQEEGYVKPDKLEEGYVKPDKQEEGYVKPDKLEEGYVKPDKQEEGYVKPDKQEEGFVKPDKQEASGKSDTIIADTLERKEEEMTDNIKTTKIEDDVNVQLKHNVEDAEQKQALTKLRECQTYDEEEDEDSFQFLEYDTRGYYEARKKYEYFWKGRSIYSQWHKSEFYVDHQRFICAEQYMMFQKAVLFQDKDVARKILWCNDPRRIKSLGREVRGFVPDVWDQHCLHVVKDGNIAKFSQNEEYKNELMSTFPKVLVEASPFDRIWGIGLDEDAPLAWDETTWEGKNYLGYVLTEVRDDLMIDAGVIKETDRTRYIDKLLEEAGINVDMKMAIPWDNASMEHAQAAVSGISDTHSETDDQLKQDTDKSGSHGNKKKYKYFWKGSVFSQWYKCKFDVDGITFCCAEQFMMYKKAVLFDDMSVARMILRSKNPGEMKSMGRNLQGFDEDRWQYHSLNYVKEGNLAKFTQNDYLLKQICETYPKILVEASPYDKIWGIGVNDQDPRAWQEDTWQGMNYLGYVLTEVRDELMTANGKIKGEGRMKYIAKLQEGMSSSVDRNPHNSMQDRTTLNPASGHRNNDATLRDKSIMVTKEYDEHKDCQSATLVNDDQTQKGTGKKKKGKKNEAGNLLGDSKDARVKEDEKVNRKVARAPNPIKTNNDGDKKVEHVAGDEFDATGKAGHAVMNVGKTEEEAYMVLAEESPVLCSKSKKKKKQQQKQQKQNMDAVEAIGGTNPSDKNGSPEQPSSTLSRRQKKNMKNRKHTLVCWK